MSRSTALYARAGVAGATPPFPFLYQALRVPARAALERWFDLTVEGLERLPARGPYIVAANHHNYLDGVVLAVAVPHPIAFLVMPRVWRATPLHPLLHRQIGSIPLNLERPDVGALRKALATLQGGARGRHLPRGAVQRARAARARPARRRPARAAGRRAGGPGRESGAPTKR